MSRREAITSLQEVRARIEAQREEAYRAFAASLLPGVKNLRGVRLPALRRLAREIVQSPFAQSFLALDAPQSFEETMLLGFVIAAAPLSDQERFAHVARFVPLIDNWSVCDSFCITLKGAREARKAWFAFLTPYLYSAREFEARFGTVMLLDHFVCDAYREAALEALAHVHTRSHYARMAVAWAVQTFYATYPERVEAYLAAGRLDEHTTALAVTKIAQSHTTEREALARLQKRIVPTKGTL